MVRLSALSLSDSTLSGKQVLRLLGEHVAIGLSLASIALERSLALPANLAHLVSCLK